MNFTGEKDVLVQCIRGNGLAQEAFVKMFSDLVYRSVQHALKVNHVPYNEKDLEDLHNTVFLKLFEKGCWKLKQYKGTNGCSLKSWIRLITVRLVIDSLRKSNTDALTKEGRSLPLEAIAQMKEEGPEIWRLIEKKEQIQVITEGLEKMLPRDKLFLKLHFFKGLSVPKAAAVMGIPETNAHSLKHRAVKRLKKEVVQNSRKDLVKDKGAR